MKQIRSLLILAVTLFYSVCVQADQVTGAHFVDVTEFIQNPDGESNEGWEGNTPTIRCGVIEHWNITFDTYQTLEGLPNGIYTLSLQAFYRVGYANDAFEHWQAGTGQHLLIYTDNGETVESTPVVNIFDGARLESKGMWGGAIGMGSESSVTLDDGTTLYVPNDMESAAAYFADSVSGAKYINTVTAVVTNNKLRIGIKVDTLVSGHWALWDNWSLHYYGEDGDAYSNLLKEQIDNALEKFKEQIITTSLLEDFKNKTNSLQASTAEEYNTAKVVFDEEIRKVEANIAAWNTYKEQFEYGRQIVSSGAIDNDNEAALEFVSYLNLVVEENIKALTLSTEELVAGTKLIKEKIANLWEEALNENSDVTSVFFRNTDFGQSSEGWKYDPNMNHFWENTGIACTNWSSYIYQETNMAPPGLYEMTLNGLYRKDYDMAVSYDDYLWRQANGLSFLSDPVAFVNGGTAPLKNIFDEEVPVGEIYDNGSAFVPSEDSPYWYPSYSYAYSYAFDADKYEVSAYGAVKKQGDPLVIGVDARWNNHNQDIAFDNIRVVYRGYQMEYVSAAYDKAIEFTRNKYFGNELRQLITPIEEAAEAAKAANDGITLFESLAALNELTGKIDSSAHYFSQLLIEAVRVQNTLTGLTGELVDEMQAFTEQVIAGVKDGEYSTSEANDLYWELINKRLDFVMQPTPKKQNVRGGTEFILPISFTNKASNISAFQCRITLPQGLSIPLNEDDEYDIWLNRERVTGSHTLISSLQNDGSILVAVYSSKSSALKGIEGDMFYIRLRVADDAEECQQIHLSDIRISTSAAVEIALNDQWTSFYVKHYTPADVNNDGSITAEDRNVLVDYMNGVEMTDFVFETADLNEDGQINVIDLMALTDTLTGATERPEDSLSNICFWPSSVKAKRGTEFVMPIYLSYDGDISAIEGNIWMYSEFISIESIELSDRFISGYELQWTKQNDGINFVIYSPTNSSIFNALEGSMSLAMNLNVKISDDMPEGQSVYVSSAIESACSPGGAFDGYNSWGNNITLVLTADANGDGTVTTEDLNSMLKALAGRPDYNFTLEAADINDDGELSIVDVVSVIRILLGQGATEAEVSAIAEEFGFTFIPEEKTIRSRNVETWSVAMKNTGNMTAFQCDIYMPNDVNVMTNENGEYDIRLSERVDDTHKVIAASQNDGSIRVIVYSDKNAVISDTEGELFTIGIEASLMASTSSQIEIRNIRACTPDAEEYRSDNVTASLTVKHYTPADVNDDGTITISDVVSVVNGLLGIASKDFVFDAADMDQNGTITIVDVVAVVNTLLNGGINPTKSAATRGAVNQDLHITNVDVEGESVTLTATLDNASLYTGLQFDMMLPEGMRISDVRINGNSGHMTSFKGCRVVAYSLNNKTFESAENLVTVTLEGYQTSVDGIGLIDVCAASTDGKDRMLSDAYTTDLQNIPEALSVKASDGCIVIESQTEQDAMIVSSNGIVENFRLTIGTNRLPISGKGVYIVKIGKTIVKTNVK